MTDSQTSATSFVPEWDRQDRWTLRFLDPTVEQAYLDSMSEPGRLRFQIANIIATPLWLVGALLGPPLLGIPAVPLAAAATFNLGAQAVAVWLTRHSVRPRKIWTAAFIQAVFGASGVVVGSIPGGTFPLVGAAALMTVGVTAIGLVRPASWVAAAIGLIPITLFAIVITALGALTVPAVFAEGGTIVPVHGRCADGHLQRSIAPA